MSHWNFRESETLTQASFEDFKEYFKSLCAGNKNFIEHYFREDKFEFYWRSNLLQTLRIKFPGIQITALNLKNGKVKLSWKTPLPFVLLILSLVLLVIIANVLSNNSNVFVTLLIVGSAYLMLLIFYNIGTKGLREIVDHAAKYHKVNAP